MMTIRSFFKNACAVLGLFGCLFTASLGATAAEQGVDNPKVIMKTTDGDIIIELFAEKSPVTVENFLTYVDAGYYDGTVFHRVISNFMIQGGGFTRQRRSSLLTSGATSDWIGRRVARVTRYLAR